MLPSTRCGIVASVSVSLDAAIYPSHPLAKPGRFHSGTWARVVPRVGSLPAGEAKKKEGLGLGRKGGVYGKRGDLCGRRIVKKKSTGTRSWPGRPVSRRRN